MISQGALNEFTSIWKREFGVDIPPDEAMQYASKLLTLFDAIYRPIEKEEVYQSDDV